MKYNVTDFTKVVYNYTINGIELFAREKKLF